MMYDITGIFPIPVYSTTLDMDQDVHNFVQTLEYTKNQYNTNSVNSYILECQELHNIKQQIILHIKNYCDTIICSDTVGLKITQSWITSTDNNEIMHTHYHPNSIISGVFYIAPDEPSKINFIRKHWANDTIFKFNKTRFNEFNADEFSVNVKKRMLILFPSYLVHNVSINNSNEKRFSLAFNTFYTGKLGNELSLSSLEIK